MSQFWAGFLAGLITLYLQRRSRWRFHAQPRNQIPTFVNTADRTSSALLKVSIGHGLPYNITLTVLDLLRSLDIDAERSPATRQRKCLACRQELVSHLVFGAGRKRDDLKTYIATTMTETNLFMK